MKVNIPWAVVEAAIGIGACMAAGALVGLIGTALRIVTEGRRAPLSRIAPSRP